MEIKVICTEAGHMAILREVSGLIDLDPAPDSPEGERLRVLGALVQAYEAKHFPIHSHDPTEAIESGLAQSGMTAKGVMPSGAATEFDHAWAEEAQRRLDAYRRGQTQGIPLKSCWAVLREPATAVCPVLVSNTEKK